MQAAKPVLKFPPFRSIDIRLGRHFPGSDGSVLGPSEFNFRFPVRDRPKFWENFEKRDIIFQFLYPKNRFWRRKARPKGKSCLKMPLRVSHKLPILGMFVVKASICKDCGTCERGARAGRAPVFGRAGQSSSPCGLMMYLGTYFNVPGRHLVAEACTR